jgi:hypothetical protein
LVVAKAAESYVDWLALVLWLRPLFGTDLKLPAHVKSKLDPSCAGIREFDGSAPGENRLVKSAEWDRIMKWGEEHCLSQAREEGWLDLLREQVRSDPSHVRLQAYSAHISKDWTRSGELPYPSFHQWRQAAEGYVTANRI